MTNSCKVYAQTSTKITNLNVVKKTQHLSKVRRITFPVQFEFNRFLVFNQLIVDSREKITLINFKEIHLFSHVKIRHLG